MSLQINTHSLKKYFIRLFLNKKNGLGTFTRRKTTDFALKISSTTIGKKVVKKIYQLSSGGEILRGDWTNFRCFIDIARSYDDARR